MEIPKFLAYEKKKMILPIILILLLSVVVVDDYLYAEDVKNISHDIVENALDALKLAVYNASLNGTDASIEAELIDALDKSNNRSDKVYQLLIPLGASYVPEYAMNTFGTSFCVDHIAGQKQTECTATNLDLVLPAEILRLTVCILQFSQIQNDTMFPELWTKVVVNDRDRYGHEREVNVPNIENFRAFVYSDRGKNIFNEFEGCDYSEKTLLDQQKFSKSLVGTGLSDLLSFSNEVPKIQILTPVYIFLYALILLAVGYIVSAVVLWAHRKNSILKGMGKKYYICMVLLFLLMLYFTFNPFSTGNYNIRIHIIVALLLSYLATTAIWKLFGVEKERKIVRKVRSRPR
jgi:hypothetical protein